MAFAVNGLSMCARSARILARARSLTATKDKTRSTKAGVSLQNNKADGTLMLILTRRPGENICIGDDITIAVLEVQGQQVRLGIAAPKNVPVDREEVAERKRRGLPPPR